MSRSWIWVPMLALVACNGGKEEEEPLVIDLLSEAEAEVVKGAVDPAIRDADQVVNTALAWAALVSADDQAQDRLLFDNGEAGVEPRPAGVGACWFRPQPAQTLFHIDYTAFNEAHPSVVAHCDDLIDTEGRVTVNDHPTGPVVYSTQDVQLLARSLQGALGFDRRGASEMRWSVYGTAAAAPLPEDNLLPLQIETRGQAFELDFEGGAALDPGAESWQMWGVAVVTDSQGASTEVRVGGVDAEALRLPVIPDGAALSSLDFEVCRCPIEGQSAYTIALELERLDLDLNTLKQSPDGLNDPVVEVHLSEVLTGEAVAQRVGCGEYEVEFLPEGGEIPQLMVSSGALQEAIQRVCDTGALDEERCLAFLDGARRAGDLSVSLPPDGLQLATHEAMLLQLDGGWCRY